MNFFLKILFLVLLNFLYLKSQNNLDTLNFGIVTQVFSENIFISKNNNLDCEKGDTLLIVRNGLEITKVIVIAKSSKSVSAQLIDTTQVLIGDFVNGFKKKSLEEMIDTKNIVTKKIGESKKKNFGRIAFQTNYSENKKYKINRYGIIGNFNYFDIANTDWKTTINFHNQIIDTTNQFRLYDFTLSNENFETDGFNFSFGRIRSNFVSGIGTFDGTQISYKKNDFVLGSFFGFQPDYKTSNINTTYKKISGFLNYSHDFSDAHYDGTFAFTRQIANVYLDRDFLYLQNYFSYQKKFSLNHSSEIDIKEKVGNEIKNKIRLMNNFIAFSFIPTNWFLFNTSYDATKNVYLFETDKSIADSLFDKSLRQGFRISSNFKFLQNYSLNIFYNIRLAEYNSKKSNSSGINFRVSNLFKETDVGAKFSILKGIYTDAKNFSIDLRRVFFETISTTFNYEYYLYSYNNLISTSEKNFYNSFSFDLSGMFLKNYFSSLHLEKSFQQKELNYTRFFFELSYRF